jgi:predicted Zn-dependent protease
LSRNEILRFSGTKYAKNRLAGGGEKTMHNKKSLLALGAAALALSCVNVAEPVDAQSKVKSSVPKPFTSGEKQEGAKNHPQILAEFGGAMRNAQTDYVVRVGKNIALQSGLGNAQSDFTVTMLNSPVNNAFAIPGGYVYITRQLVALCNSEAEMAGVLGHEVGHTAARHSKKRQQRGTIANILGAGGAILGSVLGDNSAAGDAVIFAQSGGRGGRLGYPIPEQSWL